ncbi:PilZ domain-containing protein [Motiliproteus coralliicola]|uniref:PilZ domain-containing protein n=1 Tax=Motiliproteus coralliicola TaxID=2283196 RepID=A0A369WKZ5_9GAMM|nr:PilZ domain-containing protein [Motiliproteus coralliicola]RDE22740.1 PilZ domain-containing protein [Motiliproteus coralliicola]
MNDLRLHPRIPCSLSAEVHNDRDDPINCHISNISPGGMMLEGGPELREFVFCGHQTDRDPLRHAIEVSVDIKLPGQTQPFRSRARLLYIRRLSELRFNLGFRFVAIAQLQAKMMEAYIFDRGCDNPLLKSSIGSG